MTAKRTRTELLAVEVGDYVTNGRQLWQVCSVDATGFLCDDARTNLEEPAKPLFVPASLFAHRQWRRVEPDAR